MIDLAGVPIERAAVAVGLVVTRVSSFILASPMLGRGTVPNLVKTGFCLALSAFWLPSYYIDTDADVSLVSATFAFALTFECLVGLAAGYLARLIILPARIAGSYVGQELGFNLGQVADPSTGSATNETGLLFDALGLVVFWASNTHHAALRVLGISFASLRPDRDLIYGLCPEVVALFSKAHEAGILIIAPLASVLFLTLVSLMVVMRAWPQVTLFSFGMGARLLVGLGLFVVLVPLIVANLESVFQGVASEITRAVTNAR